jgi:STE24 endopeptidase
MKLRDFALGLVTGAVAAYAAVRATEVFAPLTSVAPNAHEYGRIRRALAVSDVIRASTGALAFAYGPLAKRGAELVEPLPPWARAGAFAAVATLVSAIAEFPVSYAEGYRIERRYGLTEQSVRSYIIDAIKAAGLETALTAVLSTLGATVLRKFPRSWPGIAALAALPLYVLANIIVPLYILPMFNRFEKLEGPLETRLRALASRFGVGDAEILRMDMSRQTKKANAFVAGIGSTHRIVLGDTLIEHFTPEEIEFVIAHELGHYVSRDTWRLIAAAEVSTAVLLLAVARINSRDRASDTLRLVRTVALLGAGFQMIRPAMAAFSRSREWAADRFASAATNDRHAGVAAFTRLRDQNLAEDEVPGWYEVFFSTHPSLGKRIAALR